MHRCDDHWIDPRASTGKWKHRSDISTCNCHQYMSSDVQVTNHLTDSLKPEIKIWTYVFSVLFDMNGNDWFSQQMILSQIDWLPPELNHSCIVSFYIDKHWTIFQIMAVMWHDDETPTLNWTDILLTFTAGVHDSWEKLLFSSFILFLVILILQQNRE